MEQFQTLALTWGMKLVAALAVLVIGLMLVKALVRGMRAAFDRSDRIDATLKPFLLSVTDIALKALVFITAVSVMGVEMTSFVAVLAAAGLAVGMALSGTLQNFAGGVMLLIFRPYHVGDVIEAQGYTGTVREIQIFNTLLTSFDNKRVIIPNGAIANGSMVNYSAEPLRRVDFTFGIAYGDSTDLARETLKRLIAEDSRILQDPAPTVAVVGLGNSSVDFVVRVWAKGQDYWGIYFDMNEKVYNEFARVGLNIPFPQMDVHLQAPVAQAVLKASA
jgi:small conductance mechanosensitive channel